MRNSGSLYRRIVLATFVCAQVMVATHAVAGLQGDIQRSEVALLPQYCPHTITFAPVFGSKEGTRYWMQRRGEPFKALHHYCWALIAINRANKFNATAQEKKFNYSTAVSDIDFVLRYAGDDFVLMPEILTKRAEALMRLKDFSAAEVDLRRAARIKPDYWPAFSSLARCLVAQGKAEDARKVLRDGMQTASDPRALQTLLSELESRK
jgi:tetratricopeptide (TPR) repeat protein